MYFWVMNGDLVLVSLLKQTIFENSLLFSFSLVMGDPTCLLLRNI